MKNNTKWTQIDPKTTENTDFSENKQIIKDEKCPLKDRND